FFSSRRRHTRSLRDWSSDVCSSDLVPSQCRNHSGKLPHRPQKRLHFGFTQAQEFRRRSERRKPAFAHHRNSAAKPQRLSHIMSRWEEHTSELQSRRDLVCRLLLEKK